MIIKNIYVGAFGKLKDFTLELKDGINIIYGENEAGKSTLQALIKAMLYGMNSQKKDIKENARKRYMPWDTSQVYGKLFIEDDKGQTYIISRSFGNVRREDVSSVQHSITGEKAMHIDPELPGKSFLGIGEDAFEKTLMISALGAEVVRGKDDEIMNRLTNLQQSGDSGVSYHIAMKKLEEAKKSITNTRRTGRLDEVRETLYNLQEEKREITKLHDENISLLMNINNLNNKKVQLSKKIELLEREKLEIKPNFDCFEVSQYDEYVEERYLPLEGKRRELKRLKFQIDEKLLEVSECEELLIEYQAFAALEDQAQGKVLSLDEERKSIEARLKQLKIYKEEINGLKSQLQEKEVNLKNSKEVNSFDKEEKRQFPKALITMLGVLLAMLGAVVALVKSPFFYLFTLIGVLISVFNIVRSKTSFSSSKYSKEASRENYKQYLLRINEIESAITIIKTKIEEKEKVIETFNEEELLLKLDNNMKFLYFIFNHCNVKSVKDFIEKLNAYKDLKKDLANIQAELYALKSAHLNLQTQIFNTENEISRNLIEEYDNAIKSNTNQLLDTEKEIVNCETSVQFIFKDKRQLSQIEEEIAEVEQKIKAYEFKLSAIGAAQEVLKEAFNEIQSSFGPKLNNKTAEILGRITSDKYGDVLVGDDYSVRLITPENKFIKEVSCFSSGTSDQIYLALRLALAEILFEDKSKYLVILDDAFTQYDDRRLSNVLDFLVQYSSKVQIIIFTCQSREGEYLKNRCNYIKL